MSDRDPASRPSAQEKTGPRVAERRIISEPGRTIQVERVRISEAQRSSMASALRTGRASSAASE